MPVLWDPLTITSLQLADPADAAVYTLNIITTQVIERGISLRFQMYDGLHYTYDEAVSSGIVAEFDLIVRRTIPAATVIVVKMDPMSTALYGYTGSTVYAANGRGVPASFFGYGMSMLCFAFAPTASGGWTPARGKPMFAIGFQAPPASSEGNTQIPTCCSPDYTGVPFAAVGLAQPSVTAPNFPDQWSGQPVWWTFDYEVVFPIITTNPLSSLCDCLLVEGIKVDAFDPFYVAGSWSNLRDVLAQPWTTIKDNFYSTSVWSAYYTQNVPDALLITSPDTGPYILAAMPGQLAPVYFRPRYKDIDTDDAPVQNNGQPFVYRDTGSAEVAFLVTSPLDSNQTIYFSVDSYNTGLTGFGPRQSEVGSAPFVFHDPSFIWTTGCKVIPAGTVIVMRGIGAASPTVISVENAHDSGDDVGVVTLNRLNFGDGQAVVSICVLSTWGQLGLGSSRPSFASDFVTAVLSDQYSGDFPPLSPMLTTPRTRFTGTVVYGRKQVYDNAGLPGTVQSAMINSAEFTQVNDSVPSSELPAFLNMETFEW